MTSLALPPFEDEDFEGREEAKMASKAFEALAIGIGSCRDIGRCWAKKEEMWTAGSSGQRVFS